MVDLSKVSRGDILSNSRIQNVFGVSNAGGMRRSTKNNCLVLIADHTKSIYEDKWIGDEFHYTGMGQEGDQLLSYSQNKTISDSNTNGVELYLFEVFKKNQYVFQGRVKLNGAPYITKQPDKSQKIRSVYVFPLVLIDNAKQVPISKDDLDFVAKSNEKIVRNYSDQELLEKIKSNKNKVGLRTVLAKQYERDPLISEYVKRKANGVCTLCEKEAPFLDKSKKPFLEVHHIEWLSNGGEDTLENTVALCPNCHRKMHHLNLTRDKQKLLLKK